DTLKSFMRDRYGNIHVLANLPFLTNSTLRETTSLAEKQAQLNRYIDAYKAYDSIAVFDLKGNVIVQSKGDSLSNPSDQNWFKEVLNTGKPILSNALPPNVSNPSGRLSLVLAAP